MKRILTLISTLISISALAEKEVSIWPYPEDTPITSSVSIGMASDRPVDISRFLLARGVSSAKLNKSGSHIGFISNVTGEKQVWIYSLKEKSKRQLTFGNGIDNFFWHPNNQQILYSADNNGDEQEAYYLINLNGQTEEVILKSSNAYRSFGQFDAQGKKFSYASTERNGRDFDIYLHDLKMNKSTLIFESKFGFYPQSWQPHSTNLLMTEVRGEDAVNVHLLNSSTGKSNVLFKPQIAADFNSFSWLKDGSGFYYSSNVNGEMNDILFYDIKNKSASTLFKGQYNLENVRLCDNDKYLIWTENNNGYDQLNVFDLKEKTKKQISITQGVYRLSCSIETTILAVVIYAPDTPGTLYTVDLSTAKYNKIIRPNLAGINPKEMIAPEIVKMKARDGVQIQGLLYLPKTLKHGLLPPLVIDIHGGPASQSKPSWQPLTQYLLGKGIAVLDINVRGSTGFGKSYTRLDDQKKRLDSVRDLIDALNWLEKDGRVDTKRAAAIGGSYGGYMVNAVMGAYPGAFKAGASFVGVSNWVRALETASPGLKASDRLEYGNIREEKWQSFYADNSPINTVHNIVAPMFYEHGVNDPRDPVEESDSMVKALRNKNIPVKYLRFPDEGHSIEKVRNRVHFYRELALFLEQQL